MEINTTRHITHVLRSSADEWAFARRLSDALFDLCNAIEGQSIVNMRTGEVISTDDIIRTASVLDGIFNKEYTYWEEEPLELKG